MVVAARRMILNLAVLLKAPLQQEFLKIIGDHFGHASIMVRNPHFTRSIEPDGVPGVVNGYYKPVAHSGPSLPPKMRCNIEDGTFSSRHGWCLAKTDNRHWPNNRSPITVYEFAVIRWKIQLSSSFRLIDLFVTD